MFDSIFLADQLALGADVGAGAAHLARAHHGAGGAGGADQPDRADRHRSTTYTEPFNLARQFASLDHISGGRVGWNIVTSWLATAAAQLRRRRPGQPRRPLCARRGVHAAWSRRCGTAGPTMRCSTTAPAAATRGRTASARSTTRARTTRWPGPLNMPRGPQGRPVFVQAGSSDTGRRFAARHAEAVFTAQMEKATAQAFYADLKALVAAEGPRRRAGADPAGPQPVIALHRGRGAAPGARAERAVAIPRSGAQRLSGRFGGHDFSHLPLDRPLSPEDFPDPGDGRGRAQPHRGDRRPGAAGEADAAAIAGKPRRRARPLTSRGTPEQIADLIEDWFTRRRGGRLQPDAAGAAGDARRLHRARWCRCCSGAGCSARPMRARRCATITACTARRSASRA